MAKKKAAPTGDYAVGKNKPPVHSRFPPGRSGNPGGRKKGTRNFKTILWDILHSQIDATRDGQRVKLSVVEGIVLKQAQDALAGDHRVGDKLLDRYQQYCDRGDEPTGDLEDDDEEMLQNALARLAGAARACGADQEPDPDEEAAP